MASESISNVRIAVFGESGSGKTTLLSTFFGAQQTEEFIREKQYLLSADKKAQALTLLANYHEIKDEGTFPSQTFGYEEYNFSIHIPGLEKLSPALKVTWLDYPGKWWTQDIEDEGEIADQKKCFADLLTAQVGILLIDGAKFKASKEKYIRTLLDQFKNEIKRIHKFAESKEDGVNISGPETWIIALSKADLLPDMNAETFQTFLIKRALVQFNDISKVLNCDDFGQKYLILSSVKTDSTGQIIDPESVVGIDCIAPCSLVAALSAIQEIFNKQAKEPTAKERLMHFLKNVFYYADMLDDFLPEKYQYLTKLIKKLNIQTMIDDKLAPLVEQRNEYIKQKDIVGATIAGMLATFKISKDKKVYFEC